MSFRLHNIGVTYANNRQALARITMDATRGEKIAIIGPSGAGKTSLLRVLAAAQRPTDGRIAVLEENPWALSAGALRRLRSRIGMIRQAPPIPPRQRVITAVLAGRVGRWPWWKSLLSLLYPADIDGAHHQLARLDLADRLFERCDRLSGGQLQRVGVTRVLYQQPDLMLADEPVSAMDPVLAEDTVNELIIEAKQRAVTLVASLHAVDIALRWFPRIVGLKAGEIVFDLPPVRVTHALLRDLYSTEGEVLPTLNNAPLVLPAPGFGNRKLFHP